MEENLKKQQKINIAEIVLLVEIVLQQGELELKESNPQVTQTLSEVHFKRKKKNLQVNLNILPLQSKLLLKNQKHLVNPNFHLQGQIVKVEVIVHELQLKEENMIKEVKELFITKGNLPQPGKSLELTKKTFKG